MKIIYKYPIGPEGECTVMMPRGAKVLSYQNQEETACIWALVDPDEPTQPKRFYLVGTGYEMQYNPSALRFIGTALFQGGIYVNHLFEFT